jgi:hypothetical protein
MAAGFDSFLERAGDSGPFEIVAEAGLYCELPLERVDPPAGAQLSGPERTLDDPAEPVIFWRHENLPILMWRRHPPQTWRSYGHFHHISQQAPGRGVTPRQRVL